MSGPQSKINTAAASVGSSVATNAVAHVPSGGTTATIDSSNAHKTTIVAGGHVNVIANDVLSVFGIAGAIAGGAVGVGGSVLVLSVKSVTDAGIAEYATVTANGAVTVSASMDEHSTPISFAGGGGIVGVGATVGVLNDSGTQNAHIDDHASIAKAGGSGLTVSVSANRDVHAYAIGGSFGGIAAGAAVAVVNVDGDATATIGNVSVGGTSALGGLTVSAYDDVTTDTYVIAVAAGIGLGLGAAVAVVDLGGTLEASSGAHGSLAGAFSVTADGHHAAKVFSLNVATGAAAVGVTVDKIENGRNTEAAVTSSGNVSFTTPATALVQATASNSVEAEAPGGAAGGVAIAIIVAIADLTGHTTTTVDGDITNASGITISAIADNTATATTTIFGVSVIGLTGGVAIATIGSGADIETTVGSGATLSGGPIVVEAKTRNNGNKASATAQGGTGGLLFAGTLFVGIATIEGSVQVHMNGSVTGGTSLDVTADAVNHADAFTFAGSVSLGGALAGSVAYADITNQADVVADASSAADVAVGGTTAVSATADDNANAEAEVVSFGFISLGVAVPTATIGGGVSAGYDGSVTGGGLSVEAMGTYTATVDSHPIAIGVVAGNGAAADAEVTADAQVNSSVGSDAVLTLGGNGVTVESTVVTDVTATMDSAAFGGLAVSVMFADAHDRGGSHASFDGELVSASQLKVQTNATRSVDAHLFVVAIALAASAAFADGTATIGDDSAAVDRASIGGDANIHSAGTAITVSATRGANTFAEANGGAGGLLASGTVMKAVSSVTGAVKAYVDDGATVGTNAGKPGGMQLTATDYAVAPANAIVGSGALGFTAGGSITEATASPTVEAYLGSNVDVVLADGLGHDLTVTAKLENAEADANSKSYGGALGIHVGAPLAKAWSEPVVHAYIGGGTTSWPAAPSRWTRSRTRTARRPR